MNLLQHEMLKAVLLNVFDIHIRNKNVTLNKFSAQCLDNNTLTAAACDFFMLQKQIFICILQKSRDIAGQKGLITGNTEYQR